MRPDRANLLSATIVAVSMLGLSTIIGCGPRGPKTFPVSGKLEMMGGDIQVLAGSHIEGALVTDSAIRTSAVIKPDGSFNLETPFEGATIKGAREGKYEVRIVLQTDDQKALRKAEAALAWRFQDFKASGLTFEVPAKGPITLQVSAK